MRSETRASRLVYLRELFLGNPRGFTARELSDLTGVHIRTIQRDLTLLGTELGVALSQEGRRYRAINATTLGPLHFTIPEARAVYIAVRLFLRYADEADPAAATALGKLVNHLPGSMQEPFRRTVQALQERPAQPRFVNTLDIITAAWAERRVLRLRYRSAGRKEAREILLEPYFLDASAAGYATYVIGYSRTHGEVRTLKVERVEEARATPETFIPRPEIDVQQLLASSWGIMWGEETEVVLRFDSSVAWRVREARWHPSQRLEPTEDGGCILRLRVGHTMELAPWIRSWGSTVEVLEPPEFRAEVAAEARRLAALYTAET